jgi:hypothetical protein
VANDAAPIDAFGGGRACDESGRNRLARGPRATAALVAGCALLAILAAPALAHETREVGPYTFEVGLIEEPVYAGEKSGLELQITKGGDPLQGLERSLSAEVKYGEFASRALPLSPVAPGEYEAVFFPTAAGPYTFHITGQVEDAAIDESFTSNSNGGFNLVQEAAVGQYPVAYPPTAEIAENARQGKDAAGQLPLVLALGVAGVLLGLVSLAVSLANRRTRS